MKLYEINQALESILSNYLYFGDSFVDAETGEVLEEDAANMVLSELNNLQMAREEKLENLACWIKGMDADVAAMKNEEKNLTQRRKSLENKRERIFNFLYENLNGEKITSPRVKVSYRKTAAVEITDLSEIPDTFRRVKITEEADKTAIKEAIKAGDEVPGATLVERLSMSIK